MGFQVIKVMPLMLLMLLLQQVVNTNGMDSHFHSPNVNQNNDTAFPNMFLRNV